MNNKQKHLTPDSRITIETQLNECNSFKSIARILGKDCTTISFQGSQKSYLL